MAFMNGIPSGSRWLSLLRGLALSLSFFGNAMQKRLSAVTAEIGVEDYLAWVNPV
jgi:hypothetical protein